VEIKWFLIAFVVFFLGLFASIAIEGHDKDQCRMVGIQAGKTADEIGKICK